MQCGVIMCQEAELGETRRSAVHPCRGRHQNGAAPYRDVQHTYTHTDTTRLIRKYTHTDTTRLIRKYTHKDTIRLIRNPGHGGDMS